MSPGVSGCVSGQDFRPSCQGRSGGQLSDCCLTIGVVPCISQKQLSPLPRDGPLTPAGVSTYSCKIHHDINQQEYI